MKHLVLYGKADCELCEEMKAIVEAVGRDVPFTLEVVDIDSDPELARLYALDIPVLLIDGRKAFKHRLEAAALRRRLAL